MTDPIARARQLLALAADKAASPEEARSSAFKAALLIAEHKFELVENQGTEARAAPRPDPWDGRVDPKGRPGWPASPAPTPPPPPPANGYVPRRSARRGHAVPHLGRVPIPAQHNGICPVCGNRWAPGDTVAYKRGLRMTCLGCRDKP